MNNNLIKLGIIGNPLSHSISPTIQNVVLKSANINGSYEKFEIDKNGLEKQINYFKENNYSGFNITIPYKVEIIKYLDSIDPEAEKIGAINTVKISDTGELIGYNTDIYGFKQGLKSDRIYKNAIMFGCGGASLAVIFALNELNCQNLTIAVRNTKKAEDFISNITNKISTKIDVQNISQIKDLSNQDLLINATPLGTIGQNENSAVVGKYILQTANQDMLVYDLVYNPQETLLIKIAKELNLQTVNGLPMLLHQGAKAFEIWTGLTPDIGQMKTAAIKALKTLY